MLFLFLFWQYTEFSLVFLKYAFHVRVFSSGNKRIGIKEVQRNNAKYPANDKDYYFNSLWASIHECMNYFQTFFLKKYYYEWCLSSITLSGIEKRALYFNFHWMYFQAFWNMTKYILCILLLLLNSKNLKSFSLIGKRIYFEMSSLYWRQNILFSQNWLFTCKLAVHLKSIFQGNYYFITTSCNVDVNISLTYRITLKRVYSLSRIKTFYYKHIILHIYITSREIKICNQTQSFSFIKIRTLV